MLTPRIVWAGALLLGCASNRAAKGLPAGAPIEPAKTGYSGQGASSVSPEVLAKYAPPALPSDLSRRIQAVMDLRAPGRSFLTPDHKRLFFEWDVTGNWQVWRLDGPNQFPIQVTGGEDPSGIRAITPDGRYLVVSRDRKGEENPGLYLQPVTGGALQVIQHKAGTQTWLGFVTDDSRFIIYLSNDLQPDSYAIYRYEIATGRREVLFDQPGHWSISDYRDNGGRLLLRKDLGPPPVEIYEYRSAEKKLTPILGQGQNEEYWPMYGARPGELLVVTNKFGDFRRLYSWSQGKFTPLSPDARVEVEDFTHDRLWHRVFYVTNDGGVFRTHALDAHTYRPVAFPEFDSAAYSVVARAANWDGRISKIAVSTTRAPDRTYLYDWQTRKLTEWVLPSVPEVDTSRFVEAKLESYPARDGTAIPMWVQRPAMCATAPCPVIVVFHGGPSGESIPTFDPRWQLFLESGFVVAKPNVRGSVGYGKAWSHADDGVKRLKIITDIEDAARYFRVHDARNGVAPKLGVMGGSYGGYSALMAMTEFAGSYDAGVSLFGISDLVTEIDNTAPRMRAWFFTEYGDPAKPDERAALEELSPIQHLGQLSGPVMLVAGATDPTVPVGESVQMHDALAARGIDVPLVIFPDEGHGSRKRDNQVLEFGYALQFFQRHLLAQPQ